MRQPAADPAAVASRSRSQIRDAALRQFAAHGFKGATIRGIAVEAGVSPGRVQHHFRSKQALRDECDAYVRTYLRETMDLGAVSGAATNAAFVADTHRELALVVPYLAMSLVSDAPTASRWFDEVAGLYHGVLTGGELGVALPPDEDIPAIVAVYTAMHLGLASLAKHVYRRLGADERDHAATARIGRARLYLAAERLIGGELEAGIRAGLAQYQRSGNKKGGVDEYQERRPDGSDGDPGT